MSSAVLPTRLESIRMNINPMRFPHQSPQIIHRLDTGCVLRLEPAVRERRLRALRGAVWITAGREHGLSSGDIWLMPGDEWVLPAGAEALLEGWPRASVEEVTTAPHPGQRVAMGSTMRSVWSLVAARLGLEVRRGARLVGIEGPIRLARRAARVKGHRRTDTDWGGLYSAGVPRREA
jgi:hypothetical protein